MHHKEVLRSAQSVLSDRAAQYGSEVQCFDRIAKIATLILNKNISVYDVSMMLVAVKLGRLQEARQHPDNYIDGVNYLAFASQFSENPNSVETAFEDDIEGLLRDALKNESEQVILPSRLQPGDVPLTDKDFLPGTFSHLKIQYSSDEHVATDNPAPSIFPTLKNIADPFTYKKIRRSIENKKEHEVLHDLVGSPNHGDEKELQDPVSLAAQPQGE